MARKKKSGEDRYEPIPEPVARGVVGGTEGADSADQNREVLVEALSEVIASVGIWLSFEGLSPEEVVALTEFMQSSSANRRRVLAGAIDHSRRAREDQVPSGSPENPTSPARKTPGRKTPAPTGTPGRPGKGSGPAPGTDAPSGGEPGKAPRKTPRKK